MSFKTALNLELRKHKTAKFKGEVIWNMIWPIPRSSSWLLVNLILLTLLKTIDVETATSDMTTNNMMSMTAKSIRSRDCTDADF